MTAPTKFYSPEQMVEIADLFESIAHTIKGFDNKEDSPLFINSMEIVIRHSDGYAVGRIFIEDDFPVFELVDEDYGEPEPERDDSVEAAIQRHIRQEDTASGRRR